MTSTIPRRNWRRSVLLFVVLSWCAAPRHAPAAEWNITWDNAPPLARQMVMTEEEFRSLLRDSEKPYAAYAHGKNGYYRPPQQDGQSFVFGRWNWLGKGREGPLDLQYRPLSAGLKSNPYLCEVTSVFRYAPPKEKQPDVKYDGKDPLQRMDMRVWGRLNNPSALPEYVRRAKAQCVKTAQESKDLPNFFKNRYVSDLGFGLDRNDLYARLGKGNSGSQITVNLCESKSGTYVEISLSTNWQAVSNERAIRIARNAAALTSRKVFGVNANVERDRGEAGILDVYIASKLGETPQEDVRESKVKLGERFYLAVVFRPTQPGTPLFINARTRPSGEAVTASEARAPLMTDAVNVWHNRRVLDSKQTYHPHVVCFDPKGQVMEDYSDHAQTPQSTVQVKSMGDGNQVLYWGIQTGVYENLDTFFLGLGRWDVELSLSEYRGKEGQFGKAGMELQEVSTEKVPVYILDNPEVSKKFLKESPK